MRRVVLPLFALAVLLPSVAIARTQFLCGSDLVVRKACCCPPKKAKAPLRAPAYQRECCQVVDHVPVLPSAAVAGDDTPAPIAIVPITITPVTAPARDVAARVIPRAQAPPLEHSLLSQHAALLL